MITEGLQVSRDLLSQKVADTLRREIIEGRIPDGTRLVENELASKMGVSRAPLRVALIILERERLVRYTPGKGAYVRALNEDSVRQLFAVRTQLEAYAVELAAQRVAQDSVQARVLREMADRLAVAVSECQDGDLVGLDLDLHHKIWELSGNDHLVDVLKYLTKLSRVILSLQAEKNADWREVTSRTHRQLVEAVASGDPKVAGDWIRENAGAQLATALSALNQVRGIAHDAPRG